MIVDQIPQLPYTALAPSWWVGLMLFNCCCWFCPHTFLYLDKMNSICLHSSWFYIPDQSTCFNYFSRYSTFRSAWIPPEDFGKCLVFDMLYFFFLSAIAYTFYCNTLRSRTEGRTGSSSQCCNFNGRFPVHRGSLYASCIFLCSPISIEDFL